MALVCTLPSLRTTLRVVCAASAFSAKNSRQPRARYLSGCLQQLWINAVGGGGGGEMSDSSALALRHNFMFSELYPSHVRKQCMVVN